MKSRRMGIALALLTFIAGLLLFVEDEGEGPVEKGRAERFASADTGAWVSVMDPERAAPGYTLLLYEHRMPFLMDLSGRVVHSWPEVRAAGRARLDPDGRLLVITPDDRIEEYDWEGRMLFRYTLPEGHRPHHDLIRLRSGNLLVLAHFELEREASSRAGVSGYLSEVDREGATVWRWDPRDHAHRFKTWDDATRDPSHINSVHELGENPAFAGGDQRFRPGNLLVSGRNLHTIFVIDKVTSEIVWQFSEGLDFQHEALMIPADHPHAGQIVVFNNGLGNRQSYRRSRVQVFDPSTSEKVWEYSSPYFFSSTGGVAQPLWNGNFMVTSSQGGRVFEVARDGDVVWQWEPPYLPMRPIRYPRDHCPQLAELDWQPAIARARATPFLDRALYDFSHSFEPRRRLKGWSRPGLPETSICRQLIIPPKGRLSVHYGLHGKALKNRPFAARFVVEIRDKESGVTTRLLDDEVRSDHTEVRRELQTSLADHAFVVADLCLDAQALGETGGISPRDGMAWLEPKVQSLAQANREARPTRSRAERKLRERQLRMIGYIQ